MTVVANNLRVRTSPDPNRLSCWCGGWGYFHNTAKEPPEFTLCGNCLAAAEKQSNQSHGPHTELVSRLKPFLRHTNDCAYQRFDKRDDICRCGLEALVGEITDALSRSNQYPTEDAYLRACRALHWHTAQLRANGIEPIQITDDMAQYPPNDAFPTLPNPQALREATIEECAKVAERGGYECDTATAIRALCSSPADSQSHEATPALIECVKMSLKHDAKKQRQSDRLRERVVKFAADVRWKELGEGSQFTVIDRQMLSEMYLLASALQPEDQTR